MYCGWFCWYITKTVGGVNALVAICYVLWAAQIGCWLGPNAPKLWNYAAEMEKDRLAELTEVESSKKTQ